jgi:hypothetical protein
VKEGRIKDLIEEFDERKLLRIKNQSNLVTICPKHNLIFDHVYLPFGDLCPKNPTLSECSP